jgi:hypothetical protein
MVLPGVVPSPARAVPDETVELLRFTNGAVDWF